MENNKHDNIRSEMLFGWHTVDETRRFYLGDHVIDKDGIRKNSCSTYNDLDYKFQYDESISEEDAIEHILSVMNIMPPASAIVSMSGILGVLRQLMRDANIPLPSILYFLGKTQSRKTSFALQFTTLFNRLELNSHKNSVCLRVNSSKPAIEEYDERLKDLVFILDDLYRETNKKDFRENESHVRNLIRNHSDDTPRTTKNNSYSNNSQPIITAEYLLNSLTDIGRIFLIKIDEAIDSYRLTKCQENPLALSTFYMYFIKWLCKKYDEIVKDMKEKFQEFRKNPNYHISKYGRLNEQIFIYTFAFDCFVQFASKYIDFDTTTRACFIGYIVDCVKDQSDIMERIATKEKSLDNLSLEIVDLMDYNKELIGEKGSDCFYKGKYLYITNQFFAQYLYKKYYQIISAKHITAYFRERGISEHYADHRIKKYHNRCYLILNIKTLRQDAKLTSYNNIFYNP